MRWCKPKRKRAKVEMDFTAWVFDENYNRRLAGERAQLMWRLGRSMARFRDRRLLEIIRGK